VSRAESTAPRAGNAQKPAPVPHLRVERALWKSGAQRVVGVDEVGVGSLSGPVVAAAVLLHPHCKILRDVRDSKVLAPPERERLAPMIRQHAWTVTLGAASVAEIQRLNIYHATHLAMRRALARVGAYDHALIDGRTIRGFDVGPHTEIIDGDATCFAIACASIVAKVTRDRLMAKLAARFPAYGWEHNVGYSTPEHKTALREHGVTCYHRVGYAPVRAILSPEQIVFDLDGADAPAPPCDE